LKNTICANFQKTIELFIKIVTKLSKIWVRYPGYGEKPIPDPRPGVKKHRIQDPDPQHWFWFHNTGFHKSKV